MGSLQRSTERLGARRQRHILSGLSPLLMPQQFGRDRVSPVIALMVVAITGFVVAVSLALGVDLIATGLQQVPSALSASRVAVVGAGGAVISLAFAAWNSFALQRALGQGPNIPRQLAAAVRRELSMSKQRRADVERFSLSATAAWLLDAEHETRLLLQCADHWVLFTPPAVDARVEPPTVHQRWIVERLHWTHALVWVSGHGPSIQAPRIPVAAGALAQFGACEVLSREQLPLAVQGALPSVQSAYRR